MLNNLNCNFSVAARRGCGWFTLAVNYVVVMFTVAYESFLFLEAYKEAFDAWRDKVSALIFYLSVCNSN